MKIILAKILAVLGFKYALNFPNPDHPQKCAKFSDSGDVFCTKCLIHDTFFKGGGSWIPDRCPKCGGTECRMWQSLSFFEKKSARKLFDKMWEEKHR